jgi:hypothetical protein
MPTPGPSTAFPAAQLWSGNTVVTASNVGGPGINVYPAGPADSHGHIKVRESALHGAFGSNLVTTEELQINLSFAYGIHPRLAVTASISGGYVAHSSSKAVLHTGPSGSGAALLQSRESIAYHPGQGLLARFTAVFTSGTENSHQEIGIGAHGILTSTDCYAFGFNGTQFGVVRRRAGIAYWTYQSDWNGEDRFDGTGPSRHVLDPTKGYPYQIQLQWLGFGAIKFYIEEPSSGDFILVHTIRYAGTETDPSILNPNVPLYAVAENHGNTSDIILQTPSMGALSEGSGLDVGSNVRNSFHAGVAAAGTAGKTCYSIRNKLINIMGGVNTNRVTTHVDQISIRAASANDQFVTLYLGATLSGSVWSDLNTSASCVEVDTSGTMTIPSGYPLATFCVAGGASVVENLSLYAIRIRPGETLTIVHFAEQATVNGRTALSWHEEF